MPRVELDRLRAGPDDGGGVGAGCGWASQAAPAPATRSRAVAASAVRRRASRCLTMCVVRSRRGVWKASQYLPPEKPSVRAGPGAPHGAWPLVAASCGTRGCHSPTRTRPQRRAVVVSPEDHAEVGPGSHPRTSGSSRSHTAHSCPPGRKSVVTSSPASVAAATNACTCGASGSSVPHETCSGGNGPAPPGRAARTGRRRRRARPRRSARTSPAAPATRPGCGRRRHRTSRRRRRTARGG